MFLKVGACLKVGEWFSDGLKPCQGSTDECNICIEPPRNLCVAIIVTMWVGKDLKMQIETTTMCH